MGAPSSLNVHVDINRCCFDIGRMAATSLYEFGYGSKLVLGSSRGDVTGVKKEAQERGFAWSERKNGLEGGDMSGTCLLGSPRLAK